MRKKNFTPQGNEVIYILVSKNRYSFFIAKGAEETLRETYRHHLKLRRAGSVNFINGLFPERPCLFVLEKIDPEERSNLLLVWLRILREKRLVSFNHPELIEQSEHLYYDNIRAYEKRKQAFKNHPGAARERYSHVGRQQISAYQLKETSPKATVCFGGGFCVKILF